MKVHFRPGDKWCLYIWCETSTCSHVIANSFLWSLQMVIRYLPVGDLHARRNTLPHPICGRSYGHAQRRWEDGAAAQLSSGHVRYYEGLLGTKSWSAAYILTAQWTNRKDTRVTHFKGEAVSLCLNLYVELAFKLETFSLSADTLQRGFDKLDTSKELSITRLDF